MHKAGAGMALDVTGTHIIHYIHGMHPTIATALVIVGDFVAMMALVVATIHIVAEDDRCKHARGHQSY